MKVYKKYSFNDRLRLKFLEICNIHNSKYIEIIEDQYLLQSSILYVICVNFLNNFFFMIEI